MDLSSLRVETRRLLLRPYTEDDYRAMADLHARPEVARYLMWEARDAEASRAALDRHLRPRLDKDGDAATLAAFERVDGRFVGEFVLFLRSQEHRGGEIGYILHPDVHGRGLATDGARAVLQLGFETIGLHRVIGRIDARNAASAAVLEKLGMRREAHFVKNERVKGAWTDEVVYALLAEEWSSTPGSCDISWNTTAPASSSSAAAVRPPA